MSTVLDKIISKIIKIPNKSKPDQDKIHQKILKIIQYKTIKDDRKIEKIDEILFHNHIKTPLEDSRQNYIFEKIGNYFLTHLNLTSETRILDIGGANGNLLSYLGDTYNIPKSNLYCLEESNQKSDDNNKNYDAFKYKYNHDNIHYIFWDDDPASLKHIGHFDIIICMVVLHHIPEPIIHNAIMPFIHSHISSKGYLLIKEHDARSVQMTHYINWEHHLYYMLEYPNQLISTKDITNYLHNFTSNYKKMEYFIDLFQNYGLKLKKTFTNVFEPTTPDFSNHSPTKLYWQLFQNS